MNGWHKEKPGVNKIGGRFYLFSAATRADLCASTLATKCGGVVSVGVRDVIVSVIVFGMFFWTPVMSRHLLRKYNTKILGEELALIGLPIIAAVGFYTQDWETAMLGLMASAGYFLGLWYVRKKKVKRVSSSYYALTPESARDEQSDFLIKAMNDCRPDSGAYAAAKTELARRADVAKNWRTVGIAVIVGLIGLAFWWLRG